MGGKDMPETNYKWSDPSPAGLMALAVALIGFFALLTGKVDGSAGVIFAAWLIGGAFVHALVGIFNLLQGKNLDGNMFTFFSAFLMLVPALGFLVNVVGIQNGLEFDARISGYLWIPIVITLWAWSPALLKMTPLAFNITVLSVDIAFPIVCLVNLGVISPASLTVAGYLHLIAAIMAMWLGAAAMLNTTFGKQVLPVGSPLIKSGEDKSMPVQS